MEHKYNMLVSVLDKLCEEAPSSTGRIDRDRKRWKQCNKHGPLLLFISS